MAKQTIVSPSRWGMEIPKLNGNFTELYTNMEALVNEKISVNICNPPVGFSPCIGDGSADDTTAFMALYNAGFDLYIPAGKTFILQPFALRPNQTIYGQSMYSSTLKLKSGSDATFITIGASGQTNTVSGAGLYNLRIDCNGAGQSAGDWDGVAISGYNDNNLISRLHIRMAKRDCLNIGAAWTYFIHDIQVRGAGRHGIYNGGTDNSFAHIWCNNNAYYGIYEDGANNRWVDVKTISNGMGVYSTGLGVGLYIDGTRNDFIALDSQENGLYGIQFAPASVDNKIIGFTLDNNGVDNVGNAMATPAVLRGYGIYAAGNIQRNQFIGGWAGNRNSAFKVTIGAYYIGSTGGSSGDISMPDIVEANLAGTSYDGTVDGINFGNEPRKYIEKSANFTLAPSELGCTIYCTNASDIVCTIPDEATVPGINRGRSVDTVLIRNGTGKVSIAGSGSAAVNSANGYLHISARYGVARIKTRKAVIDRWNVDGDLSATGA